jgi:hypothetical protein
MNAEVGLNAYYEKGKFLLKTFLHMDHLSFFLYFSSNCKVLFLSATPNSSQLRIMGLWRRPFSSLVRECDAGDKLGFRRVPSSTPLATSARNSLHALWWRVEEDLAC